MDKVCAFFGHREIWRDISTAVERAIRSAITEHGMTVFWVGGYGAFDFLASHCVRRLKKDYPQIKLHLILAYIPTRKALLEDAYDRIIYPAGLELVPKRFAISQRNRWIIHHCDMVIAYVRNTYGGAYSALQQAKKKGCVILNLAESDNAAQ